MACVDVIQNQCVVQGDDWYADATITEDGVFADGVPVNPEDLTGATLTFKFYEEKGGSVILSPTVTITNALLGQISISLTSAQTEGAITTQDSRTLTGQLLIEHADGTKRTYFELPLTIHRSYN